MTIKKLCVGGILTTGSQTGKQFFHHVTVCSFSTCGNLNNRFDNHVIFYDDQLNIWCQYTGLH